MARPKRLCPAGDVFRMLNRSVARMALFDKPEDDDAFLRVVDETWRQIPLPILALVVMPNHWHFVVQPANDEQVTDFFRRLNVTHTMRWQAHDRTGGSGHVHQGRFKPFPVQSDELLLTVLRYVERNPLRANLCARAEDWRWGTACLRRQQSPPLWLLTPRDPASRTGGDRWSISRKRKPKYGPSGTAFAAAHRTGMIAG